MKTDSVAHTQQAVIEHPLTIAIVDRVSNDATQQLGLVVAPLGEPVGRRLDIHHILIRRTHPAVDIQLIVCRQEPRQLDRQ
eukprot:COSAG05_NODE_17555_length_323_cov_0.919643_1_plen_80_part_10